MFHCVLGYGWLMSLVKLLMQNDNTNQEFSNDASKDPRDPTSLSNIKEVDLDHHQEVLHLGQVCLDKSVWNTRVPLPKQRSHTDAAIAHLLLPNSQISASAIASPLFKHQKSTLTNKLSKSDDAPSTLILPLHKSSVDQNVPQPKASADSNVAQHQKATFEVVKRFMWVIVFKKRLGQ